MDENAFSQVVGLQIIKVMSKNLLHACQKFLAQDPIANVLPLGDLFPPLLQVSSVYSAIESDQVVGVCTVYRAYPTPSIVLGTTTQEVKQALAEKAISETQNDFISLCRLEDIEIFKMYSTILHSHCEQQMTANPPKEVDCSDIKVEKVRENELKLLNRFYREHDAEAWVPIQFRAGPYYCVKHNDEIVSAAGVHLVTSQIAQLGNIITDEPYRNRHFATACTSILAADLASKGRIISLFVRTDNTPAIHLYEKLGFYKEQEIACLVMRKNDAH